MTLKDWKKVGDGEYLNKKNSDRLIIDRLHFNKRGKWSVELSGRTNESLKSFKTKASALKFARAYMKKN